MFNIETTAGPAYILKPDYDSDLLLELEDFVQNMRINLGWISGIGAVSRANIRYYEQASHSWIDRELDHRLEVLSLLGNVSLTDGRPIIHAHVTLCDESGRIHGGHLAHNTRVFNMEMLLTTLSGPTLMRKMDARTGLTIW